MRGAALLWACALAPAATGKPAGDPCDFSSRDDTACFLSHEKDILAAYGLESAAERLAMGAEMRRALFVDDWARNVVAVEFLRAPGRSPWLRVYRPAAPDGTRRPPLEAEVSAALWKEVLERDTYFDRPLAPVPEPKLKDGDIVICSHSWTFFVEATDPDAGEREPKLRQRAQDSCADGLAEGYAMFLAEAAVRAIPPCQALDARWESHPGILVACGMLEGDRAAAAQAYAAMDGNRDFRFPTSNDDAARIWRLFANSVDFSWGGASAKLGSEDAARRWVAEMIDPQGGFWPERAVGERSDRVRILGYVLRHIHDETNPQAETQTWRAPAEQLWVLGDYGDFRIEGIEVGAFVRIAED